MLPSLWSSWRRLQQPRTLTGGPLLGASGRPYDVYDFRSSNSSHITFPYFTVAHSNATMDGGVAPGC